MCLLDYDEYPEAWSETTPVARKEHTCCICLGKIRPRQRYLRVFTVFEGEAESQKVCGDCKADWEIFAEAHGGQKPSPNGFLYELEECESDNQFENDQEKPGRWQPMIERIKASRRLAGEVA